MAMANSKQKKPKSKKLMILALVGLCLVAIAIIAMVMGQRNDRARFASAVDDKDALVAGLVQYLGNKVVASREQNECFNTEQGPFDKGRLWCQTATIIRLSADVDYQELGNEYLKIGQDIGEAFTSDSEIFPAYSIRTPEGVECNLQFINSGNKNFGRATSLVIEDSERPAVSVSCAARAKTAHF